MSKINLFQPETTILSGAAGDFPSASSFYDTTEIDAITVMCLPAGLVARTVRFTFADSSGNVMFTFDKALAATTVLKLINIGKVVSADDLVGTADGFDQFMCLPPKVRISLLSAAVNIDVAIVGR